jgi:hypothetical protein
LNCWNRAMPQWAGPRSERHLPSSKSKTK